MWALADEHPYIFSARSLGKVIFLHLSVSQSVHRGGVGVVYTPRQTTR